MNDLSAVVLSLYNELSESQQAKFLELLRILSSQEQTSYDPHSEN